MSTDDYTRRAPFPPERAHRSTGRGRSRRIALFAAVAVVAGGSSTAAVAALRATSSFSTAVTASHSGLCLSTAGGTGVVQTTCDESRSQTFTFTRTSRRGYSVGSGDGCLTLPGDATDGTAFAVGACPGTRIRLRPGAIEGGYQLVTPDGRCLDVLTGEAEPDVPLGVWSCADPQGAGNQTFLLADVPAGWRVPTAPPWRPGDGGTSTPTPSQSHDHGGGSATPTADPSPTVSPSSAVTPTPAEPTSTGPGSGDGADWRAGSPVSTQSVPGAVGTNPDWGRAVPPANASLSRAYLNAVQNLSGKSYQPKTGECTHTVHARYWTWGADGKVYPTWHPAQDPSGCFFGHEHGDDPRTSSFFATIGWAPFGYTNEQLAPSNPASQRDEDHVGHKVAVQNGVATHKGNDPRGTQDMSCDTYVKFHQGTHSADALTNNLHELFYNVKCTYLDTGKVSEGHVQVLLPIGHPGSFKTNNLCDGSGNTEHTDVGPVSPADSPDGGFSSRRISDLACAQAVASGSKPISDMDELWQLELHVRNNEGLRLDFNPYMIVGNPSRYHDPAAPNMIGRNLDLCYQGARGAVCDKVRALGEKIAWDDVRSPFTGARRHFDANRFVVVNTGPTTWYTDVFGQRFSSTSFPGAITQYVSGNTPDDGTQGDIFQPYTDYGKNGTVGVHAPN